MKLYLPRNYYPKKILDEMILYLHLEVEQIIQILTMDLEGTSFFYLAFLK